MGRRSTSARLVGRDGELADLLAAVRSNDPERPVILVTGEAGIGKSRLLVEAAASLAASSSASEPMLVARGSCLRLADGELPFAPILEMLASIRERGPSVDVERLYDRLVGAGPAGHGSPEARTLRFIEILDVLAATAAPAPLVLMLDDAHWADRSTLDLLLFLARRLRGSRIALVLAYRSDELHRRHPLRPVIAELRRGYVREHIELGPLDDIAVLEQIGELAGSIDRDAAARIATRADGNPFYVEELVALQPSGAALPPSVRDILLARLAGLRAITLVVLQACAVVGREVDEALLDEILDLDAGAIAESIRDAVERSVLVPTARAGAYRFRHALLEEAVYDDLLPSDRVPLHRRVAAALRERSLTDRGRSLPGELARHLDAAGEAAEAIDAYLEAADVAFRAMAWAEGVTAYERASELAAAEFPGSVAGSARWKFRDLLRQAALAMSWSGSTGRAVALLRQWIAHDQADGVDPATTALLALTLTRILNDGGDEAGAIEATSLVTRLVPADDSSVAGIELMTTLAAHHWIEGRTRDAIEIADRAVAGGERSADPSLLFNALVHRAEAVISMGRVEAGLADVERARGLQREHGWLDTYGHLATNVASALLDVGHIELAQELWQEALRMSRDLGVTSSWDPWNLPGLAACAFLSGRWADADAPIAASRALQARGMAAHFVEAVAGVLAAGRGDLDACDQSLSVATENGAGLVGEYPAIRDLLRAARAEAAREPQRRLEAARDGLRALEGTDSFVLRSRLAAEAASAAADLVAMLHVGRDAGAVEDARVRAAAMAAFAADLDAGSIVPEAMSVPWTRVNAKLSAAEAARANGADDPDAWVSVAEGFEAMGMAPRVAYARFRGAVAAVGGGDRPRAETLLRDAAALATSIGMRVLLADIGSLARAARINLESGTRAAAERPDRDPWGLSPREREVLALLAEGRTNGEIGVRLFISTKTASVHVTHILDKMGVSSRTEAALLGSRAGIVGR